MIQETRPNQAFEASWDRFYGHENNLHKEVGEGRTGRAFLEGIRAAASLTEASARGTVKYFRDKDYLTAFGYGIATIGAPIPAFILAPSYALEGSLIIKAVKTCERIFRLKSQ